MVGEEFRVHGQRRSHHVQWMLHTRCWGEARGGLWLKAAEGMMRRAEVKRRCRSIGGCILLQVFTAHAEPAAAAAAAAAAARLRACCEAEDKTTPKRHWSEI